jgi:hypothetical protein
MLTIFFGPLGMFYSTIVGGIVMLPLFVLIGILTLGFGLVALWPIAVIWAAVSTNLYNKKLLERHARA